MRHVSHPQRRGAYHPEGRRILETLSPGDCFGEAYACLPGTPLEVGVFAAAEAEALTWPGVYYVRTWLNEGRCEVGDSLMYVLIGADIRPNCIDALQKLVGHIKNELVVEKEIFA